MSRSRKRSSRSPAFPTSTRCSGRRCARPARRWASTATTPSPSPRASSAPAPRSPWRAPSSSRSRTATRAEIVDAARRLSAIGFKLIATSGTQRFLAAEGIACGRINKVLEGRPHIVDAIKNGEVQLVFNTTEGAQALVDSRSLRRAALLHRVPYYTTIAGATAVSLGIEAYREGSLEVRPLQSYFATAA